MSTDRRGPSNTATAYQIYGFHLGSAEKTDADVFLAVGRSAGLIRMLSLDGKFRLDELLKKKNSVDTCMYVGGSGGGFRSGLLWIIC